MEEPKNNRLLLLKKAKFYFEMLSESIDPLTGEYCADQILQNEQIKNIFCYVTGILEELILNGGEIGEVENENQKDPEIIAQENIKIEEFSLTGFDKKSVVITSTPLKLQSFVTSLNRGVDRNKMKGLASSSVRNWLIGKGYLEQRQVPVIKQEKRLCLTEQSESIGIMQGEIIDKKTGEVKPTVLFGELAQQFIVDHLEEIVDETKTRAERIWTKEEEASLIEEYTQQGLPIKEIAVLHERKNKNIKNKIKELNIPLVQQDTTLAGKRWTKEEDARLIEEYTKQRLSISDIAKKHQRKYGGIRSRLQKHGFI